MEDDEDRVELCRDCWGRGEGALVLPSLLPPPPSRDAALAASALRENDVTRRTPPGGGRRRVGGRAAGVDDGSLATVPLPPIKAVGACHALPMEGNPGSPMWWRLLSTRLPLLVARSSLWSSSVVQPLHHIQARSGVGDNIDNKIG